MAGLAVTKVPARAASDASRRRRIAADALRVLAMDAVQKARSGHPGMPMGMADAAVVLWTGHLKFDPACPAWVGNAPGGRSGNDRTSVGPSLPMWVRLSAASSASSARISPIDAGLGAPAASSAPAIARARTDAGSSLGTSSRHSTSIRHGAR